MRPTQDADVVVAGAGPAGLTLAIELSRRGHSVIIVEKTARDGYKGPRTYLINNRTMEQLRRWGVADELRRRNPIDPDMAPDVVFATTLTGHEIHTFPRPFVGSARETASAENAEWTPQATIERVLIEHAESSPSTSFEWGSEVVDFEDDGAQVITRIRSTDGPGERELRSRFLVGADGSHSVVRRGLGIRMEGTANLMRAFIYHIRVPELKDLIKVPKASFYWFVNGSFDSYSGVILNTLSANGDYSFGCFPAPPSIDPDDHDDVRKVFFAAVGQELPMEFVAGRSWNMHALIAPSYGAGRVFIAGDAAHLIPNLGGFGFNLSVLDAVDLGWKLGAVLGGWGGDDLLASYTAERQQADTWVTQVQMQNAEVLSHHLYTPGLEGDDPAGADLRRAAAKIIVETKTQEFSSLGAQKGYRYLGSPIIADDGSAPAPQHPVVYTQSSRPGSLAPHAWLADGSSLYDHLGPEFTLVIHPGANVEPFLTAAGRRGLPLAVLELTEPAAADLYSHRFTLVRPDQHVAWRGSAAPSELDTVLALVTGASGIPVGAA